MAQLLKQHLTLANRGAFNPSPIVGHLTLIFGVGHLCDNLRFMVCDLKIRSLIKKDNVLVEIETLVGYWVSGLAEF